MFYPFHSYSSSFDWSFPEIRNSFYHNHLAANAGRFYDSNYAQSFLSNRLNNLNYLSTLGNDAFAHGASNAGLANYFAANAATGFGAGMGFASTLSLGQIISAGGRISAHENNSSEYFDEGNGASSSIAKNCSHSGDVGTDFKFTNMSKEANFSDFTKQFTNSKCCAFTCSAKGLFNIICVSLTLDYHPQMRICKINKGSSNKYEEIKGENKACGNYASKYYLEKGEYCVEVGCNNNIDYTPFKDIQSGGFACCISQQKSCLQDIISKNKGKCRIRGNVCEVPVENGGELNGDVGCTGEFCNDRSKNKSNANQESERACGKVDYSVTPCYNEKSGVFSYFCRYTLNSGSASYSSSCGSISSERYSCAQIDCKCDDNSAADSQIADAEEPSRNCFKIKLKAPTACELANSLSK